MTLSEALSHRLQDTQSGALLAAVPITISDPETADLAETSYAKLLESAMQLRTQYTGLRGKALAVGYENLCDFVTLLLAFDGWCNALYLLPDNISLPLPADCEHWPDVKSDTGQQVAESAAPVSTSWYLATSGTTDKPKWIGHSLASLSHSIKHSDRLSGLVWGLVYQPFRFAGLQVVLQALLTQTTLVDASTGDISMRLQRMRQGGVKAISATPTMWRRMLMSGQLSSLPLIQITLGGEIADQGILDALAHGFPKARIRHIYASTEAGVGFSVSDNRAGFPKAWLEHGYDNIRFKVDQYQHLWIKPQNLAQSGISGRVDPQGYLDSEDLVEIKADRVVFLGRASGSINVGGNKVHPQQVEQVLLSQPDVMQARVYGLPSGVVGQLVAAQVVAVKGVDTSLLKKQLLKHCMQQLQRHQIPVRIYFVDNIDGNAAGKISRSKDNE